MAKKPKAIPNEKSKPRVDADWFRNRMADLDITPQRAADHFSTYPAMVWRMTSGHRKLTPHEICEWARLLKVSVAVILRRLGEDPPAVTVPVIGIVREHGRVSILPPAAQRRADAPGNSMQPLVALDVDTAQTALALYDGSALYYEPASVVRADAFGRLAIIELGDHAAPIVGVLDRGSVGRGRIVVFGGTETLESSQIISATPVRWIRAG